MEKNEVQPARFDLDIFPFAPNVTSIVTPYPERPILTDLTVRGMGCLEEYKRFEECMKKNNIVHPDSYNYEDKPRTLAEKLALIKEARNTCKNDFELYFNCAQESYPKFMEKLELPPRPMFIMKKNPFHKGDQK